MEVRITITEENKEKIMALINAYFNEISIPDEDYTKKSKRDFSGNYLSLPPNIRNFPINNVTQDSFQDLTRANSVGTWGQFNSFFPSKAALRILANKLHEAEVDSMVFGEFVDDCIYTFNKTKIANKKLNRYRGFPRRKKDTAVGRFVWHFLATALDMGFFTVISDEKRIPSSSNDWYTISISLTQDGLEYARMENPFFDSKVPIQVLSENESNWMLEHLNKLDKRGYKEYSLLMDVYDFLKAGNNGKEDLWDWFENDERFITYVQSWSRKKDTQIQFNKQLSNLAKTFASSKIALLRELLLINTKRGEYNVIKTIQR